MKKMTKRGVNIQVKPAIIGLVANPVTISLRAYHSSHHLWAAKHFSILAYNIEKDAGDTSRFDIRHRAYVTSSIFSAVVFLEAAINELFQDIADEHDSYIDTLDVNSKQLMSDFWQFTEQRNRSAFNLLDKFQLALTFMQKKQFLTDRQPFQDIALVVKLRNELIHYKPKSLSNKVEHKLAAQLKGKFQDNQLMKNSGNPWFPGKCLGYGCASWATDSANLFADEFFSRIEVVPNYQRVQFQPSPDDA